MSNTDNIGHMVLVVTLEILTCLVVWGWVTDWLIGSVWFSHLFSTLKNICPMVYMFVNMMFIKIWSLLCEYENSCIQSIDDQYSFQTSQNQACLVFFGLLDFWMFFLSLGKFYALKALYFSIEITTVVLFLSCMGYIKLKYSTVHCVYKTHVHLLLVQCPN